MINKRRLAMAVEKLMGLTSRIPKRTEYNPRDSSARCHDDGHLTCIGASAMELGAFTAFLYFLKRASGSTSVSRRSPGATDARYVRSAASRRICPTA